MNRKLFYDKNLEGRISFYRVIDGTASDKKYYGDTVYFYYRLGEDRRQSFHMEKYAFLKRFKEAWGKYD